MPNAAPETTGLPGAGEVGGEVARPRSCRRSWRSASRPPRPSRRARRARSGPRTHSPSGHAAALLRRARRRSRSSRLRGHSASPGTTKRMPQPAACVELARGVDPGQPLRPRPCAARRGSRSASSASRTTCGAELGRPAPQQPGSPGSASRPAPPGPAARPPVRSSGPASSVAGQQRLAGAQAAAPRRPRLARPAASSPRRSATVQARRCTRVGAAPGEPAVAELVVDELAGPRASAASARAGPARDMAVEPPARSRRSGSAWRAGPPRPGPAPRRRSARGANRSLRSPRRVAARRCRMMSIRSGIGPVILRR